jgi:iron-sulfur cluster assembly accessory protein
MSVTLTETARGQIRQIMDAEDRENAMVRMYIVGGGCAGLQYHMAWDDEFDPALDARYEQDGVSLITRKKFALHLDGTTVDYQPGPTGGFTVENPNYPKTGGCPGCHGG